MTQGATPPARTPDLSLLALVNVVLAARRLVVGTGLALAILTGVVLLLLPRTWTSTSVFMPQGRRAPSAISGLAAQFGLAAAGLEAGQTPAFYADLLGSRELLAAAVDSPYVVPGGATPVRLADVWGLDGAPEDQRERAIRRLRSVMSAEVSQRTGTVQLAVGMTDPALAAAVNDRLLDLLNRFNLESRQSQAAAERRFTERRLGEIGQALREAEDRLQAFLQQNRDYRNSPELQFRKDRLEREVSLQQQLYTSLAQAFEQAKIDEVRDTPVITVVQRPFVPVRPDPRGIVAKTAAALLLGAALGIAIAFLQRLWQRGGLGSPDELGEFQALVADMRRAFVRH